MSESGRDRFSLALHKAFRPLEIRMMTEHRDEWIETDVNLWLDRDGPLTIDFGLSDEDDFLFRLVTGAREIFESYETLRDIAVYVRSFPYRSKQLSKVRTLRYHDENFLDECYLLIQRLKSYANVVTRFYRSDRRYPDIKRSIDNFTSFLDQGLAQLIERRGYHVHKERIRDRDIRKLISLELYSNTSTDSTFKDLYATQYRAVRSKKELELRESASAIGVVLDIYFDLIFSILFDAHGNLTVPFSTPAA